MERFRDSLDVDEIMKSPGEVRSFLSPAEVPGNKQTWAFYSFGFEEAFYELLDLALAEGERRDYLQVPVVHLARHSIELSLKHAIVFISRYTDREPRTGGHDLSKLWKELGKQLTLTGYSQNDGWSIRCKALVEAFQKIDIRADRFRYPSDILGNPHPPDNISLRLVGETHWHVVGYCAAAVSMIDYGAPY